MMTVMVMMMTMTMPAFTLTAKKQSLFASCRYNCITL